MSRARSNCGSSSVMWGAVPNASQAEQSMWMESTMNAAGWRLSCCCDRETMCGGLRIRQRPAPNAGQRPAAVGSHRGCIAAVGRRCFVGFRNSHSTHHRLAVAPVAGCFGYLDAVDHVVVFSSRDWTSTVTFCRDESRAASRISVMCRAVDALLNGGCVPERMQSTQCWCALRCG